MTISNRNTILTKFGFETTDLDKIDIIIIRNGGIIKTNKLVNIEWDDSNEILFIADKNNINGHLTLCNQAIPYENIIFIGCNSDLLLF